MWIRKCDAELDCKFISNDSYVHHVSKFIVIIITPTLTLREIEKMTKILGVQVEQVENKGPKIIHSYVHLNHIS